MEAVPQVLWFWIVCGAVHAGRSSDRAVHVATDSESFWRRRVHTSRPIRRCSEAENGGGAAVAKCHGGAEAPAPLWAT